MRPSRVFNNVGHVDVEWTLLGQRYRMASMSALFVAAGVGFVLCFALSWLGVTLGLLGVAAVVFANWRLNCMNPTGVLGEITQLRLVHKTVRRPVITNMRGLV